VTYLTVSQAAERLQLSVPTIKRYIYDGRLQSVKLPGGQHRIPESEIERLLSPDLVAEEEASAEQRVEVLERWLTELQADVERLSAALTVMSRYCSRVTERDLEGTEMAQAPPEARIQVLGPGCRRCNELHELTVAVLGEMGRADVTVEHTRDLDAIAAFGPVMTPGLVINEALVLAGGVPAREDLRELLEGHLG